jgi:hypothetical protein
MRLKFLIYYQIIKDIKSLKIQVLGRRKYRLCYLKNHSESSSMQITMTVPSEQHSCLFYELYTDWPKHVAAVEPRGYMECKSNRRQIVDVCFEN